MNTNKFNSSVRGCWLGKNIGGTLGAPFEGSRELNNISFYAQKDLDGNPAPNDDLDIQLLWLGMAEYYGVYRLTPRLMGEYFLSAVSGPWNEYGICHLNCQSGFYPPLSGSVDNDVWKWSNGAWIRSEIWASLFPGDPDRAIEFAYMDACCDHCGEGIYAEMFTAALESAAFVEKNLRKLIDIALSKVPDESRIRKSVDFVCKCFDSGKSWKEARNQVVEFNRDLGWFQAPSNVAFTVIGLLYGGGDFGKTVCTAVNCGDDTDCTGATAGSVMGILLGAENIPEKWIAPIGDRIVTAAINHFNLPMPAPKTVSELTKRVLLVQDRIQRDFSRPVGDLTERTAAERLWKLSPYELGFDISHASIGIDYTEGPWLTPGQSCPVKIILHAPVNYLSDYRFRWILPEGWSSSMQAVRMLGSSFKMNSIMTMITPPAELKENMYYIPLEVTAGDRDYPTLLNVPFRRKDSVHFPNFMRTNHDPSGTYRSIAWHRICEQE